MRSIHVFVVTVLALSFAWNVQAGNEIGTRSNFASKSDEKAAAKPKAAPAAKAAAPAAPAKPDAAREAKKKRIEEKKKELNGSRWTITVTPSSGKGAAETDELTFQDNKVSFKSFADKGFGSSNYTISLPEGSETAVWETMQNSAKEGVLFVRGEWKDEQMSGVLSHQNPSEPEKPALDYTFSTQKRAAIAPSSKEEKSEAPAKSEGAPEGVLKSEPVQA